MVLHPMMKVFSRRRVDLQPVMQLFVGCHAGVVSLLFFVYRAFSMLSSTFLVGITMVLFPMVIVFSIKEG